MAVEATGAALLGWGRLGSEYGLMGRLGLRPLSALVCAVALAVSSAGPALATDFDPAVEFGDGGQIVDGGGAALGGLEPVVLAGGEYEGAETSEPGEGVVVVDDKSRGGEGELGSDFSNDDGEEPSFEGSLGGQLVSAGASEVAADWLDAFDDDDGGAVDAVLGTVWVLHTSVAADSGDESRYVVLIVGADGATAVSESVLEVAEPGDLVLVAIDDGGDVLAVEVVAEAEGLVSEAPASELASGVDLGGSPLARASAPVVAAAPTSAARAVELVLMTPPGFDITAADEAAAINTVSGADAFWGANSGSEVGFAVNTVQTLPGKLKSCDTVWSEDDMWATWSAAGAALGWVAGPKGFPLYYFRHLVVVVPKGCPGGPLVTAGGARWGVGIGSVGPLFDAGGVSISFTGADKLDITAHELGHNLTLQHANILSCPAGAADTPVHMPLPGGCSILEYYDTHDVMGYAGVGGPGMLSAPAADRLGFSRGLVDAPSSGAASHTLAPVSSGVNARALRIVDPRSKEVYFVEYREPSGYDATLDHSGTRTVGGGVIYYNYGVRVLKEVAGQAKEFLNESTAVVLQTDCAYSAADPSARCLALAAGRKFTSASGGFTLAFDSAGALGAKVSVIPNPPAPAPAPEPVKLSCTVAITGSAAVGSTLTATPSCLSPAPSSFTYQWLRNGAAIQGATAATYRVQYQDGGKSLSVRLIAKLAPYSDAVATSTARVVPALTGAQAQFSRSQSLVTKLYVDLLERKGANPVDPSGLNTWTSFIAGGGSQSQLVEAITSSDEYIRLRVEYAYRDVLGRASDAGGKEHWVAEVKAGRIPTDEVSFGFYNSAEFFNQAQVPGRYSGSSADARYVQHLYRVMLKRDASASEMSSWVSTINARGRAAATSSIFYSNEAIRVRVRGYYQTLLGREPDAGGWAAWAGVISGDHRWGEHRVRLGFAGAPEYWNRSIAQYPN